MAKKKMADPELHQKLKTTPIAIIGMASIFPQAHHLDEYWDNILNKINCITDIPASRWSIDDYYDADIKAPDKVYSKRGGFIPDIDFDPLEFGLPPNILEVTDVSQLLSLVVARDALQDAGYDETHTFNREQTGVILGVVGMSSKLVQPLFSRLQYPIWEKVLASAGVPEADRQVIIEKFKSAYVGWDENAFPGTIVNVIAGRIANRFDLGGTNCVIDAACASSLAAARMSVMELCEGRADMMITGGVDVDNSILTYMCFSKTPAFTKGDSVRTFDVDSDGMMVGEGIGMLVLKRLADAERDGDRIYAVIKGIGSSSDGRFKSIYAPRSEGQAKAIRRAYEDAGFSHSTVGLVEAHGTGTMAGDPAEFGGMQLVFGEGSPKKQVIALGSVKSQIAHTKSTAGAASLIKTSLALYNKVLPATINVNQPNPKLGIENTPFYINSETRPWIRPQGTTPRRAALSSFGFGGTNFHMVLEEYQDDHSQAYRRNRVAQMVMLHAPTQAMLLAQSQDLLGQLRGEEGENRLTALNQESQALDIPTENARLGFIAATSAEAAALLQTAIDQLKARAQEDSWESPKGIFYRKSGIDPRGKVVALFPGQGAQYVEMGRELAMNFPPVRQTIAQMDGLFLSDGQDPLSATLYPIPVFSSEAREAQNSKLTETRFAQPAIGALSVGMYKLLQQGGFRPDFTAGHSFGELTALWAAGVLSEEDYFTLAKARGQAMAPPAQGDFDAGTMMAVKGDVEQIRARLSGMPGITLANWNSKNQVVLAGSRQMMAEAQQVFSEAGFSVVPLTVSAAFHTPLVGHAQKPFAQAIRQTKFHAPQVRVFSNASGAEYPAEGADIQQRLSEHMLKPVLWKDEIEALYAAGGRFFIECGPKNILTNLVDNILADQPHIAVALNASAKKDSDRQMREAVVKLKVAGLMVGSIDPYDGRKVTVKKKHSAVTVKLNGGLYRSEKTRQAFHHALNDGYRLIKPQVVAPAALQTPTAAPVAHAPAAVPPPPSSINPVRSIPMMDPSLPVQPAQRTIENGSAAGVEMQHRSSPAPLHNQPSEISRVHQQFLDNEAEYGRIFAQITQMAVGLVSNANTNPAQVEGALAALASIERSMQRFHDHQSETLRVHEQYLKGQETMARQMGALGHVQPLSAAPASPVTTPPASASTPSAPVVDSRASAVTMDVHPIPLPVTLHPEPVMQAPHKNGNGTKPAPAPVDKPGVAVPYDQELLAIVSEKTGYPVEMLDLDMDMEADLGIDSIKRVEIVGAMREKHADLPKMEAETFAELHTLGQIIEFMKNALAPATATPLPVLAQPAAAAASPIAMPVSSAPATMIDITQALLEIVSQKTGYPTEMLDLTMDMEADLGIDSIKRVEILGGMREIYPNLPKVDPEVFGEMHTLTQVIEYIRQALPGATQAASAPQQEAQAAELAPGVVSARVEPASLTRQLLTVVSEKTGYPTEMLELAMDMEADLGIDSIKKVEIMGAMRELNPQLPKADPEIFAEARTLGQVVEYLGRLAVEATPNPF